MTNDLLRASMEQLRLEIGWPGQINEAPIPIVKDYMTECWIKSLLLYMEEQDMKLHDDCPPLLPNTAKDRFLMKEFVQAGYRKKDLEKLNACREYLRVICLSDIVSMDGKKLEKWAWEGTINDWRSTAKMAWPRRPPKLPNDWWLLWRAALEKCFLTAGRLSTFPGQWKREKASKWPVLFDAISHRIYMKEGSWNLHIRTNNSS